MPLIVKIHLIIELICILISFFIVKEKKSISLLIFPGLFILFSGPIILFTLVYSEKNRDTISNNNDYEVFEMPPIRPEIFYNKEVMADSETLFYSFKERIIPENHSLYYIKNMTKKHDNEVVILSCAALMHKEEELLKKIYKFQDKIQEEKTVENILELCNAYYNYCYFGYANDRLRNRFTTSAINVIESFCPVIPMTHYKLNFLAGKFYLLKGEYEKAHEAFSNVIRCDVTNSSLVSYLAEIDFYNSKYGEMKDILEWLSHEDGINDNIREVIEYWNG